MHSSPIQMLFNKVADIMQFDLLNSRTFKDLWNEIQRLSSTCLVFKYIQGLEFRRKKFKYFQGCVGTLVLRKDDKLTPTIITILLSTSNQSSPFTMNQHISSYPLHYFLPCSLWSTNYHISKPNTFNHTFFTHSLPCSMLLATN